MTKNDIEKKVNTALSNLYMNDVFLFEKGLCERCINHRFAKYLEEQKFDDYYIDCEYNKSHLNKKSEIKSVSSPHGNYIDIIITKRSGRNKGDLVCFETKRSNNYNNRKKDRENLEILTGKDGRFGYKIGFYVIFGPTRDKVKIEVYEKGKKNKNL